MLLEVEKAIGLESVVCIEPTFVDELTQKRVLNAVWGDHGEFRRVSDPL